MSDPTTLNPAQRAPAPAPAATAPLSVPVVGAAAAAAKAAVVAVPAAIVPAGAAGVLKQKAPAPAGAAVVPAESEEKRRWRDKVKMNKMSRENPRDEDKPLVASTTGPAPPNATANAIVKPIAIAAHGNGNGNGNGVAPRTTANGAGANGHADTKHSVAAAGSTHGERKESTPAPAAVAQPIASSATGTAASCAAVPLVPTTAANASPPAGVTGPNGGPVAVRRTPSQVFYEKNSDLLRRGDRFSLHLPKKLLGKKRHTCYLSCTPDMRQMLITKMKDDKSYVYTTAVSMQTLQILDVVAGFWQIGSKDMKSCGVRDSACCFTILFSSATWYVEAETPQKQMMWIHAISWLKNFLGGDLRRAIPVPQNPLNRRASQTERDANVLPLAISAAAAALASTRSADSPAITPAGVPASAAIVSAAAAAATASIAAASAGGLPIVHSYQKKVVNYVERGGAGERAEQFASILTTGQWFDRYSKRTSKAVNCFLSVSNDLRDVRWGKTEAKHSHSFAASDIVRVSSTSDGCDIFGVVKWGFTVTFRRGTASAASASANAGSASASGTTTTAAAAATSSGLKNLNLSCDTFEERKLWLAAFGWLQETKSNVSLPYNVKQVASLDADLNWKGEVDQLLSFGRPIGKGGFCEVVYAKHVGTNGDLAVKIYHHLRDSAEQRDTLKREIDIFKKLRHDNIVSYYGTLTSRKELDRLYVLMEYCDGGSVWDLLQRASSTAHGRPMTEQHISYILRCTLKALQYLHGVNIVHRDVKAANILLTKSGAVKLTDFGISAQLTSGSTPASSGGGGGVLAGSPLWMSPEAVLASRPDPKTDVWSVGITAIELAEGRPPYWNEKLGLAEIIQRINNEPAPKLTSTNWSLEFRDFVRKCLDKDRFSRPSIAELLAHPFVDPKNKHTNTDHQSVFMSPLSSSSNGAGFDGKSVDSPVSLRVKPSAASAVGTATALATVTAVLNASAATRAAACETTKANAAAAAATAALPESDDDLLMATFRNYIEFGNYDSAELNASRGNAGRSAALAAAAVSSPPPAGISAPAAGGVKLVTAAELKSKSPPKFPAPAPAPAPAAVAVASQPPALAKARRGSASARDKALSPPKIGAVVVAPANSGGAAAVVVAATNGGSVPVCTGPGGPPQCVVMEHFKDFVAGLFHDGTAKNLIESKRERTQKDGSPDRRPRPTVDAPAAAANASAGGPPVLSKADRPKSRDGGGLHERRRASLKSNHPPLSAVGDGMSHPPHAHGLHSAGGASSDREQHLHHLHRHGDHHSLSSTNLLSAPPAAASATANASTSTSTNSTAFGSANGSPAHGSHGAGSASDHHNAQSSDSEDASNRRVRHRQRGDRRRARSPHGKREGSGAAKCDLPALLSLSSLIVSAPSTLTRLQMHLAGFESTTASPKHAEHATSVLSPPPANNITATTNARSAERTAARNDRRSPTKRRHHNSATNPTPGVPLVAVTQDAAGNLRASALPVNAAAANTAAPATGAGARPVIRHDKVEQLPTATKLNVISDLRRARGMSGGGTGELRPNPADPSGAPVPVPGTTVPTGTASTTAAQRHGQGSLRRSDRDPRERDRDAHTHHHQQRIRGAIPEPASASGPPLLYQPASEPGVGLGMSPLFGSGEVWRGGIPESRHHDQHLFRPHHHQHAASAGAIPVAAAASGASTAADRLSHKNPPAAKASSTSPFPLVQQTGAQMAASAAALKVAKADDQMQTVVVQQYSTSVSGIGNAAEAAYFKELKLAEKQRLIAGGTTSTGGSSMMGGKLATIVSPDTSPQTNAISATVVTIAPSAPPASALAGVNSAVDRIAASKGRVQTSASAQIAATAQKAAAAAAAAASVPAQTGTPVLTPPVPATGTVKRTSPAVGPMPSARSPVVAAPGGPPTATAAAMPSLSLHQHTNEPARLPEPGSSSTPPALATIVTPKLLSLKRETSSSPVVIPVQPATDSAAAAAAAAAALPNQAPAQTGPAGLSLTKQPSITGVETIPTVIAGSSSDHAPIPVQPPGGTAFGSTANTPTPGTGGSSGSGTPSFLPVIHIPEQFSMSATPKHHLSLVPIMSDLNVPTVPESEYGHGGSSGGAGGAAGSHNGHAPLRINQLKIPNMPNMNNQSIHMTTLHGTDSRPNSVLIPVVPYSEEDERANAARHRARSVDDDDHSDRRDPASIVAAINGGDLAALTRRRGGNDNVQIQTTAESDEPPAGAHPPPFNQAESYSISNSGIVRLKGFEVSRQGVMSRPIQTAGLNGSTPNLHVVSSGAGSGAMPPLRRPQSEPEADAPIPTTAVVEPQSPSIPTVAVSSGNNSPHSDRSSTSASVSPNAKAGLSFGSNGTGSDRETGTVSNTGMPALRIGGDGRSGASSVAIPVTVINPLAPPPKDGIMANNSHQPPIARPGSTLSSSTHSTSSSSSVASHHVPVAKTLDVALCKEDLVELGVIGRGQNGKVLRCLHVPSLSLVALKTMNIHEKGGRHQLLKELHAFSKLSSQYIIPFLGAFYDGGEIALASEYMDWGSLQHFVAKRNGPLSEPVLKYVVKQVVKGLEYLHSNFQVHRDIKPENILVNHKGHVKIADFGLLKELKDTFSTTDTYLGTMAYLSPERITSKHYSYPSDIWALGVSMIFLATAKACYDSSDYWELVDMISNKPPPELTSGSTPFQYSAEMTDFLACCVRIDPDKRLTASQLLQHPFLVDVPTPRSIKCTADMRVFAAGSRPTTSTNANAPSAASSVSATGVSETSASSHSSFTTPSGIGSAANSFGGVPPIEASALATPPGSQHTAMVQAVSSSSGPAPASATTFGSDVSRSAQSTTSFGVNVNGSSSANSSAAPSPSGLKVLVHTVGASATAASAAASTSTIAKAELSSCTPAAAGSFTSPPSTTSTSSLMSSTNLLSPNPAAGASSASATPTPHTPNPTPIPLVSVVASPPDRVRLKLPGVNPPELSLPAAGIAPAQQSTTLDSKSSLVTATPLGSTGGAAAAASSAPVTATALSHTQSVSSATGSLVSPLSTMVHPLRVQAGADWPFGCYIAREHTDFDVIADIIIDRLFKLPDGSYRQNLEIDDARFERIADQLGSPVEDVEDGFAEKLRVRREMQARAAAMAASTGTSSGSSKRGSGGPASGSLSRSASADNVNINDIKSQLAASAASTTSDGSSAGSGAASTFASPSLNGMSGGSWAVPPEAASSGKPKQVANGLNAVTAVLMSAPSPPIASQPAPVLNEEGFAIVCTPEPEVEAGFSAHNDGEHNFELSSAGEHSGVSDGGASSGGDSPSVQVRVPPALPHARTDDAPASAGPVLTLLKSASTAGSSGAVNPAAGLTLRPSGAGTVATGGATAGASPRQRSGSSPKSGPGAAASAAVAAANASGSAAVPFVTPIKKLGLTLHAHVPDRYTNLKNLPSNFDARMAALRASVTTPKESANATAAAAQPATPHIPTVPVASTPQSTTGGSQYHK